MMPIGPVLALAALFQSQTQVAQIQVPHIRAAQSAYDEGKQAESAREFQHAADCFRNAIEIEPTFLDAHAALIATYLASGQRLNAAAAMTQLLEIEPDALKYRVELGHILLEEKQPEKALAQFSLVLKRDPYNAEGLLGFAAAANQVGMKERANAALERGRKRYPTDARFNSRLGESPK
jgi:tetratricopeptide (TPR) repeat protein